MSSRIADIIIQATLDTRGFSSGLKTLRTEIRSTFEGVARAVRPIRETGRAIRDTTQDSVDDINELTGGIQEATDVTGGLEEVTDKVVEGHKDVADASKKSAEKSEAELKKIRREGERLQTQMRWVARDVMKVGFTAGIIGAIFIRQFQAIARVSFDLMAIFEDIQWILEDIAWIIGEQLAPIMEMLVGPVEMVRDFLEAHKGVAKFIGILIILGAIFFTLAGLVMMTAGMYAILLFGMRQFGDTVKTIRQDTEKTSGTFEVAINLIKEMGKEMAGIAPAIDVAGAALERLGNKTSKVMLSIEDLRLSLGKVGGTVLTPLHQQLSALDDLHKSGNITTETYKKFRKELTSQFSFMEKLKVPFTQLRESLGGVKKGFKGAGKGLVGGIKKVGSAGLKAGAAIGSMILIMAAIEPIFSALEPVITALSDVVRSMMDILQPYIDWMARLIEENPKVVAAILLLVAALWAVNAAASPWIIIALAIIAALYIIGKIAQWISKILFGSGLHQAIVMVTTAFKFLLWPLYLVYKLFTDFGGVVNKAKSILSKFVGLVRGLGAWIQNIIPDSIIEFAKAVMSLLPNPIELFKSFIGILSGIWDILTGDWKSGVTKIAGAVKDIIFEFFKIPIAIIKIGASLLLKFVEAVKSGWYALKNYLSGGSLIPDIIDIFLGIPIALLKIGISMLSKLIEGIKNKVSELFGEGEGGIKGIASKIIGFFLTIPLELLKIGATFLVKLWEGIKGGITTLTNLIFGGSLIWDIIDFFLIIPLELLKIGANMLTSLWNGIKGLFDGDFSTNIKALPGKIIDFFLSLPGKMFDKGKEIIQSLMDGAKKIIDKIFGEDSVFGKFLTDIVDFFGNLAINAWDAGKNFIQSFIAGMTGEESNLGNAIDILFSSLFPWMPRKSPAQRGPLSEIEEWGLNFSDTFLSGVDKGFNVDKLFNNLGSMGPPTQAGGGMGGSGDINIHNEFVIYATIQNKEDLYTLRDEISAKQMEQARRMRVLKGGF